MRMGCPVNYKPIYFSTKELVHPKIFEVLGEGAIGMFTEHSLIKLDHLRKMYCSEHERKHGSRDGITINTWGWGGILKNCGLRTIDQTDCPNGAAQSKHKPKSEGNYTFDLHCGDLALLTYLVMEHHKELGINRLENTDYTKSWLHVEFGGGSSGLYIFDP